MTSLESMKAAVGRMAAVVAELDRPVTDLVEIDAALAEEFEPLVECVYCGQFVRASEMHCGACSSPSCQEEAVEEEIGDRRYQEWKERGL